MTEHTAVNDGAEIPALTQDRLWKPAGVGTISPVVSSDIGSRNEPVHVFHSADITNSS